MPVPFLSKFVILPILYRLERSHKFNAETDYHPVLQCGELFEKLLSKQDDPEPLNNIRKAIEQFTNVYVSMKCLEKKESVEVQYEEETLARILVIQKKLMADGIEVIHEPIC